MVRVLMMPGHYAISGVRISPSQSVGLNLREPMLLAFAQPTETLVWTRLECGVEEVAADVRSS